MFFLVSGLIFLFFVLFLSFLLIGFLLSFGVCVCKLVGKMAVSTWKRSLCDLSSPHQFAALRSHGAHLSRGVTPLAFADDVMLICSRASVLDDLRHWQLTLQTHRPRALPGEDCCLGPCCGCCLRCSLSGGLPRCCRVLRGSDYLWLACG